MLRLYSPRPKRFDEDDITLARLVASQCAVAITNARLGAEAIERAQMAEQMRLGGVIQKSTTPPQTLNLLNSRSAFDTAFPFSCLGQPFDNIQMLRANPLTFPALGTIFAVSFIIRQKFPFAMKLRLVDHFFIAFSK